MSSEFISQKVYHNPSPSVLKNIARNSKQKTARFSITPDGVFAGDAYFCVHSDLYHGYFIWEHRGYITECDDNQFYYIAFKDRSEHNRERWWQEASHHEYLSRMESFGIVRGIMMGWDGVVEPAKGRNPLKRQYRWVD